MKGAEIKINKSFDVLLLWLVTFIAKVEGVVKEKFSGVEPQTPTSFAPPPIKFLAALLYAW